MRHIKIFFGLFCVIFSLKGFAQTPLKVGVILDSSPFSFKESDGSYGGASVDIFSQISQELKWKYEFIPLDPLFDKAIEKVNNKEIDVLVGPLSVTHERHKVVDFSRPFFLNNIGVAVKKLDKSNVADTIINDLKDNVGYFLPMMLSLFVIVMFSLYFIDNKNKPKTLKTFIFKIGKSFWETLMILIQNQFDDSRLIVRRLVQLFWLLPSVVFLSIIVGSVVSSLTVLEQKKEHIRIIKKEELVGKKIAVLEGDAAADEIRNLGGITVWVSSREEALKLIDEGKVFGAADDHIILEKDVLKSSHLKVAMSNLNLGNDEFAFVFQKGSPLLNRFNQKLLYLQDQRFAENLCARHLGHRADLCVI